MRERGRRGGDVSYFHKVKVWKWAPTSCALSCGHVLSAGLLPRKNETWERKGNAGRATDSKVVSAGERWLPNERRRQEDGGWKDKVKIRRKRD